MSLSLHSSLLIALYTLDGQEQEQGARCSQLLRKRVGSSGVLGRADIMNACRAGDLVKLRRWGRQGVRVTDVKSLSIAIELGHLDVLRCLVSDLGADLNQIHASGLTPLHFAAGVNSLKVIRCLVTEYGADVNQTILGGYLPLHVAALKGCLDCVRCLVTEFGADVKRANLNGATPL